MKGISINLKNKMVKYFSKSQIYEMVSISVNLKIKWLGSR